VRLLLSSLHPGGEYCDEPVSRCSILFELKQGENGDRSSTNRVFRSAKILPLTAVEQEGYLETASDGPIDF
jgi:hypothetical protein